MYRKISVIVVIVGIVTLLVLLAIKTNSSQSVSATWWKFQSIDTMKYSRDVSREKLNDPSFNLIIEKQVEQIANTGVTHVAIATPYDEEFYPVLTRWVNAARRHGLKVWFRGNWSGWEEWFEYPEITRKEHIAKTESFIKTHRDLFEDGDVFTACPECENGGPGDPRHNGDVVGHRNFLIDEYKVTSRAFKGINKDVASNYNSMNGDVARLVMNKETTKALGGIVTIDHYVATPGKLVNDIGEIARSSGGKIVLGEFGVPIPDINGKMSEEEQARWLDSAFKMLLNTPELVGLNYWTNTGSSTELWKGDGTPKKAVETVSSYYKTAVVRVIVEDEAGTRIKNAKISLGDREFTMDNDGFFHIPFFNDSNFLKIEADGFFPNTAQLTNTGEMSVVLARENESIVFKILKLLKNLF